MATVQEHYDRYGREGKAAILLKDFVPIMWIDNRDGLFMLVDQDKGLGLQTLDPNKDIEEIETEWILKYPAPDNPGQDKL